MEKVERRKISITISVELAHYRALLDLSRSRGVSLASIVREAIEQYLSKEKEVRI
jgi:predicted DNA-binding protein